MKLMESLKIEGEYLWESKLDGLFLERDVDTGEERTVEQYY